MEAPRMRDPLPRIPAMISTRLQLELLLQEDSLDLAAVAEVILADPGATLQIFRLMAEEFPDADCRPNRLEDCLMALATGDWYTAVCSCGVSQDGALVQEWQRARCIAECARELARRMEGVSPEEAYLVGLLSRLGSLPQWLGWKNHAYGVQERGTLAVMLAEHWNLPGCVTSALREQQNPAQRESNAAIAFRWSSLLDSAERLVTQADSPTVV